MTPGFVAMLLLVYVSAVILGANAIALGFAYVEHRRGVASAELGPIGALLVLLGLGVLGVLFFWGLVVLALVWG